MKTLILTCNTGEGHNSCARGIKEYYDSLHEECAIKDALSFISKGVSYAIKNGHNYIYRHHPNLFSRGYKYAERNPKRIFGKRSGAGLILRTGSKRLAAFINQGEYNAVICTHIFACLMLTEAVKRHGVNAKTAFVPTDYAVTPGLSECTTDICFLPDSALEEDYKRAFPKSRRFIFSGIPIKQSYYFNEDKANAKEKSGLNPTKTHILIMCGSMGCGPIEEIVASLSDMLDGQCETTVICGNNKRLKNKLMGICDEQDGFRILGYTSDVPTLLTSADIFITKPGGLSVSEAYAKKVPMVFVDTVGGCESYNRDFFTSLGCATAATKDENAAEICFELINSKNALKKMNEAFTSPAQNAAKIIHDSLLS